MPTKNHQEVKLMFTRYVMVDWSSAGKPKSGKDSIWIAVLDSEGLTLILENPRTREAAMDRVDELLTEATQADERVCLGFDFGFGLAKGAARKLTGQSGWKAVWKRIGEVIVEMPRNESNRFDAAAMLNTCFPGAGPFWGNGLQRDIPGLTRKKPQDGWDENLPPRLRYAEKLVPKAKEIWQLNGAGSVGGQSLTGIAALERLRQRRDDVCVWPFQELGGGARSQHVLVEIYPSLIDPCPGNEVLDARQVKVVALTIRELDRRGELESYLRAPNDMPPYVRHEEGAILGMHDREGFRAAAAQAISGWEAA